MTACMIADTVGHVMHESSLRRRAVSGSAAETGRSIGPRGKGDGRGLTSDVTRRETEYV